METNKSQAPATAPQQEGKPPEIRAYTKKELAQLYEVSPKTFRSWLKRGRLFTADVRQARILTPAQVRSIFDLLGAPE